ncbi:MAG: Crp/Fnr family transcriptional regulator [bacterium]
MDLDSNKQDMKDNLDEKEQHQLTVVEKAVFLQGIDIFSQTKTEDLARIAAITEELEFDTGDIVFKEQGQGNALFFVISGEVSLQKGSRETKRLFPQETFGELALLDNQPREFTAVAVQHTHVLKIDGEEFFELIEDHVEIARAVLKSLTKRIRMLVQD